MAIFKNLKVWEKAHQLVLSIYVITKTFPEEEKFGLISQIRRAASSVPTNIVEGCKKNSNREFIHFLNIAETSLEETKYHLILSRDLKYISTTDTEVIYRECEEIGKMISGLKKKLKA
ncbi:MAG: four helix bundle protein [Elusimicrobia bacterium]|nr:four helix bundle protein [Candidatus Liberimonas magnetica]